MEEKDTFTRNDYSLYDAAVQTEIDKHHSIINTLKSHRFISYMKGFCLACIGISVVIIAISFYKNYIFSDSSEVLSTTSNSVQEDLNDLDSVQDSEISNDNFIETRYTVFHDAITASGEHVITGLEYLPSNVRTPIRQYCYLQVGRSAQEILAKVTDGIVVTVTQDEELMTYPSLYCNFVAS
jgi:hypothetical protein